ncbi:uncharacterized protein LOC132286095 [Cornus florida]|uniref:uncharacterized protein LOC132286095 n=1 Tax=Cornus florida TaxID=4283 RepID=UPI00289F860E|nr:uncharacterized protein LOC132286095 [Cornus florida]
MGSGSNVEAVYMIRENVSSPSPFVYDIYKIPVPVDDESCQPMSSSSLKTPVLSLSKDEYPSGMGFFSVGSKIFMIGGEIYKDYWTTLNKDVYIYDTCTCVVEKSPSAGMQVGKIYPRAMGPLHGKFYVSSHKLSDFELYDPQLQSWSLLPRPPVPSADHSRTGFHIVQHAIVDHNILISTSTGHVYVFDSIAQVWSKLEPDVVNGGGYILRLPFIGEGGAEFVDDGVWLALVSRDYGSGRFPLYFFGFDASNNQFVRGSKVGNLPPVPPALMRFDIATFVVGLGNNRFLILRSGVDHDPFAFEYGCSPNHHVIINVFRLQAVGAVGGLFSAIDKHSLSHIMNDRPPLFGELRDIRACLPVSSPVLQT